MGSAGGSFSPGTVELCRKLGRAIAEKGCCLLTGACPGQPHEVVLGAKEVNGHVVGISPGMDLYQHRMVYESPYKEYDVLIFTGLGLMGRELINIRSCDIIVIVGGRSGTLCEFAIAYEEGKVIGVLKETGGITEVLPVLELHLGKATGAEVIYDEKPDKLIDRLLQRFYTLERAREVSKERQN